MVEPAVVTVLAGGIALAALCAAADGALLALDADEESHRSAAGGMLDRRERVHRTLSFARVLGHLATGLGIAFAFTDGAAALVSAAAAAVVAVLLAESGARALGDRRPVPMLDGLRPIVRLVEIVFGPVAAAGLALDAWLERVIPSRRPDPEDREVATEQFRQVVAAEAEVSREEEAMMQGVFSLGDTEVHEIMVPRVSVLGIERDAPWSEALDRVRSAAHARLPVFEESLDDVQGILYAKDLLPSVVSGEEPPNGWPSLIRPATFIPRTKKIDRQLRDFQASGTHIAIVVDEFGGTAGLVTIEDILEEIVGEIRDEHDVEEPEVVQRDGRRFWVAGRVTLDEVSELLQADLHHDGVTTIGGLVYELLGRVPKAGEELFVQGFRVVVERVVRRRIERVYFERLEVLSGNAS